MKNTSLSKVMVSEIVNLHPLRGGQALADEFGIPFFETSAKANVNVENSFFSIARVGRDSGGLMPILSYTTRI